MSIQTIPVLTEVQLQFLKLFCHEFSTEEIADFLGKSPRTIEAIRDKVKEKLDVTTYAGIAIKAIKHGFIDLKEEKPANVERYLQKVLEKEFVEI